MNPLLPRLLLWAALTVGARADVFTAAALGALLVLYPAATAIELGRTRALRRLETGAGIVAATAALAPRGAFGAALASAWLLYSLANLTHGGIRFMNTRDKRDPVARAHAIGHTGPVIGAVAWVAARAGANFAGFGEPIATLTVVHFHTVFGALPLALAAWTARLRPDAGPARHRFNALLAVLAASPVLLGLAFAARADRAVAAPAEAGLALLGATALGLWTLAATRRETGVTASPLRTLGAGLLTCGYALGALWAWRLAAGAPFTDFATMARLHGGMNAAGLLLLTVTAARRARLPADELTPPDPGAARDAPPGRPLFRDDTTATLAPYTPAAFAAARDMLLRYDIYPAALMTHRADFARERRAPRPGDRIAILLRAELHPLLPAIRMQAVNRIHRVTDTPGLTELGYTTTDLHPGRGEWLATLFRDGDFISVRIRSTMRPAHPLAWAGLPIFRHHQLKARTVAIDRLRERATHAPPQA